MMDHPDTQGNRPELGEPGMRVSRDSGKLVLRPPVQEYSPVADEQKTMARPLPPFQPPLMAKKEATKAAQRPPLAKVAYYWRKDPAYKVFIIATCMVLIAGIVFVSLATAAVMRNPNLFSLDTGGSVAQTGPTPSGTVDFHPTFPTPGGGAGSNQSSQPPVTSTPALPTTPTKPTPTPPQNGGPLTVQILDIPSQVFNGQTVQVVVNTNTPGASVYLQVSYNVPPSYYVSPTQQADGGGNAVLFWRVGVSGFSRHHIIARVVAIAISNGQHATSQPVTVQVGAVGMG